MYMKKRVRSDLFLILCALLIWFLADAAQVRSSASKALVLCAGSVIPALFPFLVVSRLLVELGFGQWASPLLSGLMTPLFRLPGSSGSAVLLGLVGGYPIGTQTAVGLYRTGQLTREEAERLLTFCNNSNPVFLISVLGAGVFGSVQTGMWLWLIHILSALLTGLLCGRSPAGYSVRHSAPPQTVAPSAFAPAFVAAVRDSAAGMLSVCAFVVVFYVLAAPLQALSPPMAALLTGLLELFSLTPLLKADAFSFVLAAFCAGWGGLSVLAQTAAVLDGTDLRLWPCIRGKAVQSLLSALLAWLTVPMLF